MIIVTAGDLTVLAGAGGALSGRVLERLSRGVDVLLVQARQARATAAATDGRRCVLQAAHVVRTPRAAVAPPHRQRVITSQRRTLEPPAVEFTVQTLARLALVNPLLAAAERHVLQLLVLAGLFGIALRTAEVPRSAAPLLPPRAVARWLHAADDPPRTGTHLARLVPGRDLAAVRDLAVLEHTT